MRESVGEKERKKCESETEDMREREEGMKERGTRDSNFRLLEVAAIRRPDFKVA